MSSPALILSWCPGDKCDPCAQAGPVTIVGTYQGQNAWIVAYSTITHFPEFPINVEVSISFEGVADAANQVLYPGGGGAGLSGQSNNSLGMASPLAPTHCSLNVPDGWRPAGGQHLLFEVKGLSSTTVGAYLDSGTVDVQYTSKDGVPIYIPVRWIGDVS